MPQMMDTLQARRIVHYVKDLDMSIERLAQVLECSESEAKQTYDKANHTVLVANARAAVRQLFEAASELNTTADELIRCYA